MLIISFILSGFFCFSFYAHSSSQDVDAPRQLVSIIYAGVLVGSLQNNVRKFYSFMFSQRTIIQLTTFIG
jgi:hypothetical protein